MVKVGGDFRRSVKAELNWEVKMFTAVATSVLQGSLWTGTAHCWLTLTLQQYCSTQKSRAELGRLKAEINCRLLNHFQKQFEGGGASEKATDYQPDLGIWISEQEVSIYSYHTGKSASVLFARITIELFTCFIFNRRTALLGMLWYHVTRVYWNSYPFILTDSLTSLLRNNITEKPNRKQDFQICQNNILFHQLEY